MGSAKFTILLTVAVTPNVAGPTAISDVTVRLAQYRSSINFWSDVSKRLKAKLAVVETTGASREQLFSLVSEKEASEIEFLSLSIPKSVAERGKGAAEVYAIGAYLRLASDDAVIYKVTGRLRLRNADRILRSLAPDEFIVRMTLDRGYADSRVVGGGRSAWDHLLGALESAVDDTAHVYLEHVLAGAIAYASSQRAIRVARFSERPAIAGASGSKGTSYSASVSRIRGCLWGPIEKHLVAVAGRKQA